nr:pro-FMRFamide-related neuropeptide FF isoform X2 [Anolis sagrei ordinatus]
MRCLTNGCPPLSSIPPHVPQLQHGDIKAVPRGGKWDRGEERRAKQASKMDTPRLLLVLTLFSGSLRLGRGLEEGLGSREIFAEEPNAYPERFLEWVQENEDHAVQSPLEEHSLSNLLRSFLHAMQRPGRSPSFLFQPQRFGRDARSGPSSVRMNPRAWDSNAPQFLSMAVPQRFGKK